MKNIIIIGIIMLFSTVAFSQSGKWNGAYAKLKKMSLQSDIKNLTPNGCTMSPDGIPGTNIDWTWACNQHDTDYGNLEMSKDAADERLYRNMLKAGAPEDIAATYYNFVQSFGYSFWEDAQNRTKRLRDSELKKNSCPVKDN